MNTIITLSQLKPNQTFCFCRDGKIYTFKSYKLRDIFYWVDAWEDSHYDYDEYGCTVDIYVKERSEPLSINFKKSDRQGKGEQNDKKFVKQEVVQKLAIGYDDVGVNTRYLHGNFEQYIVVWFDKEHDCLQYQMFDEWNDLESRLNELKAKHIPHEWYD